ncbi:MAG TPA: 2,3-dihydroxyphenylpropionate 1,2-dioxygenase [Burkholderiales bacterium]|nr:2,3-dihydroxyphenylpropionate 1,2-dioxygenase [Burkholderiales bacterium]
MASLVGVCAASHGPLLVREWDALAQGERQKLKSAFETLGQRIAAAQPDVLIVVSPDHWSNFFLDNVPAVCIGVGESNEGPPEPWMKAFPHREIPGHAAFALHLVSEVMTQGFEPSVSHRLKLDHGVCIPLWRMGLERLPRIVPLLVNSIEPPLPSLSRCLAWGRQLASAIRSFPHSLKVGVLATGGLSHSIGEPTMGAIYDDFDRETIRLFSSSEQQLISFLDKNLPTHGNGSQEVRNWLVAHGAAGARGFELVDYLPVPKVIVGCGFASWTIPA